MEDNHDLEDFLKEIDLARKRAIKVLKLIVCFMAGILAAVVLFHFWKKLK